MKHLAILTTKPQRSGYASIPDGAITGNGDLAVILGNSPDGMRIFLSKTDVWHAVEHEHAGGLRPVGYVDLPIPQTLYDNYRVEQDLDAGVLRCSFEDGTHTLRVIYPAAAIAVTVNGKPAAMRTQTPVESLPARAIQISAPPGGRFGLPRRRFLFRADVGIRLFLR